MWHPRSRYPQPQAIQTQKTTHIELMDALIKAGADVNVRLRKNLWFFGFSNCGNANCGLEALDGTSAFWRATYGVDLEAMKLLKAAGAVDTIPQYKAPTTARRGGGFGRAPAVALNAAIDSASRPCQPVSASIPSMRRPVLVMATASPATRIVMRRMAGCP